MSGKSSKTKVYSLRVSNTHYALLNTERMSGRASALIRVLLSLYFNGKLKWVEPLLEEEVASAITEQGKHIGFNSPKRVYTEFINKKKEDKNGTNG